MDCQIYSDAPTTSETSVLGAPITITTTIDPIPSALCGNMELEITQGVDEDPFPSDFMVLDGYTLTVTPTLPTHAGTYELNLKVKSDNGDNTLEETMQSTVTILPCVITDFDTAPG